MDLAGDLISDPYRVYTRLRTSSPVHCIRGQDGKQAWIVTRYYDVRAGLTDPRLSLDKKHARAGGYQGLNLPPALDANLLNMDPPDHTRIRRLVSKAFTAGRVERLRLPIRVTADRLLDALGEAGRVDLIDAYAAPLPITVICELLGIPHEHRSDFRAWTQALIAEDPGHPQATADALKTMMRFFAELIAYKRQHPEDDLLSDLISVRDAGDDRLSEDELLSLAFLLLLAGFENTVQFIGNAVWALLRHPDQLAALRKDPSGMPLAVEELARFEGPALLAIRRFPMEDVIIGGVIIPAGETVLLSLSAANRDPSRFSEPELLDIRRDAAGHLALGHGIHYCLGAPLARVETEVALTALLERFAVLDLHGEADLWRHSARARGLMKLPVRFQVGATA